MLFSKNCPNIKNLQYKYLGHISKFCKTPVLTKLAVAAYFRFEISTFCTCGRLKTIKIIKHKKAIRRTNIINEKESRTIS